MAIIVKRKLISLNRQGFTLIELLVVIGIIGLLSTLAVISLSDSGPKARDVKRMSDIKAISKAIDMYMNTTTSNAFILPGMTSVSTQPSDWGNGVAGVSFSGDLKSLLPSGLPKEEKTDKGIYFYCAHTGSKKYLVGAVLEQNIDINGDLDGSATTYTYPRCLSSYQNPGVNTRLTTATPNCDDLNQGSVYVNTSPVTSYLNRTVFCLGNL
jgi:prepilin-type N-terminal cleavage/methylation domain-containing protein